MTVSMVAKLWKGKITFNGYNTSKGYKTSELSFLVLRPCAFYSLGCLL